MKAVAVSLLFFFTALLEFSPKVGAAETELVFPSLNDTHRFSEVQAAPVAWGPFLLHFRVKRGELRVLSHGLLLTPLSDGTHRVRITGRVEGTGAVAAELSALGFATEQADEVILPAQDQALTGRVRIARAGDVYRLTTVELPQHAKVRIQSRLGERLAGWCGDVPLLETLGGNCEGVRRAVSSVTVKLPQAGDTYEIRRDELIEGERNALDRYLREGVRAR